MKPRIKERETNVVLVKIMFCNYYLEDFNGT
jgi:hypothetical protein